MRIWLNDFELNNAAKRVWINDQIEGLDMASIRTSKGLRAGQSGSYIGAQLFDARTVSITGTIFSNDVYEAKQKRREIQAALPLYPEQIIVRVEDDDGAVYQFVAQVIDFKMPVERNPIESKFKLELEAPSPLIKDVSAGAGLSATIHKAVPGGLYFSSTTPQFGTGSFYFSGGATNSTVENTGTWLVGPKVIIVGKTTNPTITNRTTGDIFYMEDYAVGEDSVTQIDMEQHTVRLGTSADLVDGELPDGVGGSVFGYVALDSAWLTLVPGENELIFDSDFASDVNTAEVTWLPALIGI